LLFGFSLGIPVSSVRKIADTFWSRSAARAFPFKKETPGCYSGGGFAGVTTAEHLEKQFRDDPSVSFTLLGYQFVAFYTDAC